MKRLRLTLFALLLVLIGGALVFVTQLFLPGPPIEVSKETTYLTTPLADDGLPDYAAHLLAESRRGVTPENNGAIPFLQAMWPAGLKPEHQLVVCRHLGMPKPTSPGMADPESDKALQAAIEAWIEGMLPPEVEVEEEEVEAEEEEGLFDDFGSEDDFGTEFEEEVTLEDRYWDLMFHAQEYPWRRSDIPLLAKWIDDHEEQFDLLHEAARREKFYLPPADLLVNPKKDLLSTALPNAQAQRAAAQCLTTRGFLYLGEGDANAAWKECETLYRFSAFVTHKGVINEIIGISMSGMADDLAFSILANDALTPEVARAILAFQRARPSRNRMTDAVDQGDRLMFVTAVLLLSGERGDGKLTVDDLMLEDVIAVKNASVDWNLVLKEGNAWYDRVAAAGKIANLTQRRKVLEQLQAELDQEYEEVPEQVPGSLFSREARSRLISIAIIDLFTPPLRAALESEERANAFHHLQTVAAALAVYRLEQGGYPESFDALVPGLLPTAPIDLYGRRLAYRKTEDGYLLYSLGANGIDEQGSNKMLSAYEGYEVDEEGEDAAVRQLLGLPPFDEDTASDADAGDPNPATTRLHHLIPEGADDWSYRLPLPKAEVPLPAG